jgi:L-ascorbate metabolism protein UlaG (beta-lactamase superfamily)
METTVAITERPASSAVGRQPTPTEGSIRFIGNATTLLRFGGLTVMTDPNFTPAGQKVPIGYGLHARRRIGPAITFDDLPPIDLVVLSHLHGDHFDPGVASRLDRITPIVTTPQAARGLERLGFAVTTPLDPWEHTDRRGIEGRLRVTATPGRHGPGPMDALLPDVMGSVIEFWAQDQRASNPTARIYISGDTLMYAGLREIGVRFPQLDVALLHLGGTKVMGLTVTMDEEQGVELLRAIAPRLTIPIHVDDYDRFTTTVPAFLKAVERAKLPRRIRVLERGEVHRFDPDPASAVNAASRKPIGPLSPGR